MARRLLPIVLLWIGADFYFFQAVQMLAPAGVNLWMYWLIDVVIMGGIVGLMFVPRESRLFQPLVAWLMGMMLLAFVPRLFSLPFLIG